MEPQDKGHNGALLAAMQVNYVPTSALEQRFPVFLNLVRLTLLRRTYVLASTVDS